jgi:hypothetical protein
MRYSIYSIITTILLISCNQKVEEPKEVSFTDPSEIEIYDNEPISKSSIEHIIHYSFFEYLRKEPFNPNGYKFIYTPDSIDPYGYQIEKKEFYGGTFRVSKDYYEEVNRFNELRNLTEHTSDGGTQRGLELRVFLIKCLWDKEFIENPNGVCDVELYEIPEKD